MAATLQHTTWADIEYLDRLDLYKTEKPYVCTLEPWNSPEAERSNLAISPYKMPVKDIRQNLKEFSTDIQGFQVETLRTKLSEDEIRNEEKVHEVYTEEVKEFLKQRFNAQDAHIFDVTVGFK